MDEQKCCVISNLFNLDLRVHYLSLVYGTMFLREVAFYILLAVLCIITQFTTSSLRDRRKGFRPNRNESEMIIRMEQFTCNGNPNYITIHACNYKRIGQESISLDFQGFINKTCDRLQVHIRFSVLYGDDERMLVNRWEDMCAYLNGKSNWFLDMTFAPFLKHSNMNHTCPYSGELRLHVDRITASDIPARVVLPTGKFRNILSFTNGPHRHFVVRIIIEFSNAMRQF